MDLHRDVNNNNFNQEFHLDSNFKNASMAHTHRATNISMADNKSVSKRSKWRILNFLSSTSHSQIQDDKVMSTLKEKKKRVTKKN